MFSPLLQSTTNYLLLLSKQASKRELQHALNFIIASATKRVHHRRARSVGTKTKTEQNQRRKKRSNKVRKNEKKRSPILSFSPTMQLQCNGRVLLLLSRHRKVKKERSVCG